MHSLTDRSNHDRPGSSNKAPSNATILYFPAPLFSHDEYLTQIHLAMYHARSASFACPDGPNTL